jgi:protein SCO1/2
MILHLLAQLVACGETSQPPPRLKVSDRFPNVTLRDQFDREVQFRRDFIDDGRALIVNSMYTTCRGTCPGTSSTLESLRKKLSPVFGNRLTLVSFTLEPVVDTPVVLRRYARDFGAGRERPELCDWRFVTGAPAAIEQLRRGLGFYDLNPRVDADITQHASLLMFGNSTSDRWAALPAQLREGALIETIRRVAGFTFEQKYGIPS